MAGTEVFGATTVNLGPHWTVTGETFDLTAGGATDTDLSALPSAFTSTFVDSSGAITSGVKEMTDTSHGLVLRRHILMQAAMCWVRSGLTHTPTQMRMVHRRQALM